MSLYREARSRTARTVVTAVIVLAAGVGMGFGIGFLVRPDPSLGDALGELRGDVRPALDALELVPVHFESENPETRRAAGTQLAVAESAFERERADLRLLNATATEAVARDLADLRRLVGSGGAPAEVTRLADDTRSRLAGIVGARDPGRG